MKKYLALCFILFGLVVSSVALAESNSPNSGTGTPPFNSRTKEVREQMKSNREEWRGKMQTERKAFVDGLKTEREKFLAELRAKKEEWKLANAERKAMFCRAAGNMISQRFEVAVRNLERFQSRMDELILKLGEEGKDTSQAEDYLDQSKDKLEEATDKIADTRALIPEGCESVTPEVWGQIKLGAREAKDLLKESHRSLIDALKELKNLKAEEEESEEE